MDLIAARMTAQGLVQPLGTATDVVRHLVALQAQDTWIAPYAIRPRTTDGTLTDVVVNWLMRGTLHMTTVDDVGWLTRLLGPLFAAKGRPRRLQLGLTDELLARAVPILAQRLPASRDELVSAAGEAGVPEGQARAHLLAYLGMTGVACQRDGMFVPFPEGGHEPGDPIGELARRYVTGYGPAEPADFAAWSGLALTAARRALTEQPSYPERPVPKVKLLGHLDPYLLGYKDRSFTLDPKYAGRVQRGGGFLQPIVLVDGIVAGTWTRTRKGEIEVDAWASIPDDELAAEVADLGRSWWRPVAGL